MVERHRNAGRELTPDERNGIECATDAAVDSVIRSIYYFFRSQSTAGRTRACRNSFDFDGSRGRPPRVCHRWRFVVLMRLQNPQASQPFLKARHLATLEETVHVSRSTVEPPS